MKLKFKKTQKILSMILAGTIIFGAFPNKMYTKVYAGYDAKAAANDGTDSDISLMQDEHTRDASKIVSEMTLEQKIAQMLMPSFRYWENDKDVLVLNDEMRNCIKNHGFGGVIVFAENIQGTEQTVRLIDDMQKASVSGGNLPLLIATDQEGGRVTRLATGTSMSGNMTLGALNDKKTAKEYAEIMGSELSAVGINVDFAPVMDVNNDPNNPVINIRSFSSDPNIAADMGEAFIEGLHKEGVITALKHFPGHGDTGTDSHTGLPCIDKSYDEIKKLELIPFKRGIDAGSEMIMTAHIQFPQIEKETYTSIKTGEEINLPATLSKTMITDVLRSDIGYNGVVVTDSLYMAAIKEHFTLEDTAKLAINADVDMLLIPFYFMNSDDIAKIDDYINSIADMVKNNEIDEDTITRSAERIVALKLKHGLLEYNEDVEQKVKDAKKIVGCKEHHDKELEIGAKAVTLLKNDNNVFPAALGKNEKAVVFCASNDYFEGVKYGRQILKEKNIIPESADIEIYSFDEASFDDFKDKVKGAKYIIVDNVMSSLKSIDPSGNTAKFINEALSYAKKNNIHSAVMSMYMPYDVARYQNADALFAVYSSKYMPEMPTELDGETKTYGPGYTAALCAAFGYIEPQGKLPVDIYELEDNKYSDKILYNIGYGLRYEKTAAEEIGNSGGGNGSSSNKVAVKTDTPKDETDKTENTDNNSNKDVESYKGFDDVKGLWCEKAVNELRDKGIINGRTATLFAPNENLTRAELVQLLANMKSVDLSSYQNKTSKFRDVNGNAWYYAAVVWAEENNIVYGISADEFAPEKNISREDMAAVIYRYMGIPTDTNAQAFADLADISEYAKEAVDALSVKGIINGYPDNSFKPKKTATRAETAAILYGISPNF